ncbi:MAG: hypothetical protein KDC43_15135 [Saprospiraceae bacterium]|nr:hypothetical protein [Saprospiraceae bacterium]
MQHQVADAFDPAFAIHFEVLAEALLVRQIRLLLLLPAAIELDQGQSLRPVFDHFVVRTEVLPAEQDPVAGNRRIGEPNGVLHFGSAVGEQFLSGLQIDGQHVEIHGARHQSVAAAYKAQYDVFIGCQKTGRFEFLAVFVAAQFPGLALWVIGNEADLVSGLAHRRFLGGRRAVRHKPARHGRQGEIPLAGHRFGVLRMVVDGIAERGAVDRLPFTVEQLHPGFFLFSIDQAHGQQVAVVGHGGHTKAVVALEGFLADRFQVLVYQLQHIFHFTALVAFAVVQEIVSLHLVAAFDDAGAGHDHRFQIAERSFLGCGRRKQKCQEKDSE